MMVITSTGVGIPSISIGRSPFFMSDFETIQPIPTPIAGMAMGYVIFRALKHAALDMLGSKAAFIIFGLGSWISINSAWALGPLP